MNRDNRRKKIMRALVIVMIVMLTCFIVSGLGLLYVRNKASEPAPGIFVDSLLD